MYKIALFENGRFCTRVGGDVPTLPEAIEQLRKLAKTLGATELKDCLGYKFERAGTTCGLIVTDRYGFPIKNKMED